jgi:hypothetical protein
VRVAWTVGTDWWSLWAGHRVAAVVGEAVEIVVRIEKRPAEKTPRHSEE